MTVIGSFLNIGALIRMANRTGTRCYYLFVQDGKTDSILKIQSVPGQLLKY